MRPPWRVCGWRWNVVVVPDNPPERPCVRSQQPSWAARSYLCICSSGIGARTLVDEPPHPVIQGRGGDRAALVVVG